MPGATRGPAEIRMLFGMLTRSADPAVQEEVRAHLQSVREHSPEVARALDQYTANEFQRVNGGLESALENQQRLAAMLEQLTRPPLHPALFLGSATDEAWGPVAIVSHAGARLLVPVAEEVDLDSLAVGEEVLLGNERNVLVGRSPYQALRSGSTALFDRYVDGRAVLQWRDEEIVVDLGPGLRDVTLRHGDRVRFDAGALVAVERIEASRGQHLFLEETPSVTFEDIGGLDAAIEKLKFTFRLHLEHRDLVSKYRLRPVLSATLFGPPGGGKTMTARALAHWLGTLRGSGPARFMHIKPSALHSMWFSESERAYREVFRIARERGAQEPDLPVVLFFDEVDAIAAARGDSHMRVDDRVLTAFMSELDGLESRGNVFVVAATNRLDVVDPAILRPGRLGDLLIEVPRPNMKAGRAIFGKHLTPDIPCECDGQDWRAAREIIIDSAVSRLYAPNGDNELARITFRDGRQQAVRSQDLVSGASIAKIVRSSIERACRREIEKGAAGVRQEDTLAAIDEETDGAAGALTPANCRRHVSGLPQDVDVVRVERLRRPRARVHEVLDTRQAVHS